MNEMQQQLYDHYSLLLSKEEDWDLYYHEKAIYHVHHKNVSLWTSESFFHFEGHRPGRVVPIKLPFFRKYQLWRKAKKIYKNLLFKKQNDMLEGYFELRKDDF